MASIRKHGSKWRAEVYVDGKRRSKVLDSQRAAKDWAARAEYEIRNSEQIAGAMTLAQAFDRYAREVSPSKRGVRWEIIRLEKLARDQIAKTKLSDIRPADIAGWRDRRLLEVAPGTVRREMELIGGVLTVATNEWGAIRKNPIKGVRRPPKPPARDRLPTQDEIERICAVAGDDLTKATARAVHAFLFAMETGMRAGEIVGLRWENVHLDRSFAHLPKTKNGTKRDVPLSRRACEFLEALPELDPVFGLTSQRLDALWRRARGLAKVEGLTFHDSRHAAITLLSKKLDPLELAKMVGHNNLNELLTYYEADATATASKLD